MSLAGASAHPFVTVRFDYEPTPASNGRRPPSSIEVRAQLPVPSIGEVVAFRDEHGTSSEYRVLAKRFDYESDSRCVVTLSVADAAV